MTTPSAEREPIVELKHVTVVRPGGIVALRNFEWALRKGETWAIVGPVGSGKTTLAETVLGRHPIHAGTIAWPRTGRPSARLVSFRSETRHFSYTRHYYQERFDFADAQDHLTVEEFISTGLESTTDDVRRIADTFNIGHLLPLEFIKLSSGQVRRTRIARAVLGRPRLLILDDPFLGLDTQGRRELADLLGRLLNDGMRVLVVVQPESIPEWVTHIAELRDGQLTWSGKRDQYLERITPETSVKARSAVQNDSQKPAEPIVEFDSITVHYGTRTILDNIAWTVRRGERWAVLGPNGSGKSTLLSLICGDHPQAYANPIRLFGRPRGSGESIWEIKQRVGLVSPELHLYFTAPLTATEAAATGFFDVVTRRTVTSKQNDTIRSLFADFALEHLAGRPFARLSTGEQRLVLLVRALVKQPPLIILDEPFQGLDRGAINRARRWLDANLTADQTLLFVTHDESELPDSVTRSIQLHDNGIAGIE